MKNLIIVLLLAFLLYALYYFIFKKKAPVRREESGLSQNAEQAKVQSQLLKKQLEKHGDRFELVYTRSEEGRRTLLECRRAANGSRSRAKVTRARSV